MTVALELDRRARARGRVAVRADGTDRHRDRGVGDLGRRGRRGLHRRRGRAPRRRGREREGDRPALRGGTRLDHPPGVLGRDAGADPRQRPAPLRPLPPRRRHRGRGLPGHSLPSLRELVELHERSRYPSDRRKSQPSRSIRASSTRTAHARQSRRRRRRPACPPTIRCRFGAEKLLDAYSFAAGCGDRRAGLEPQGPVEGMRSILSVAAALLCALSLAAAAGAMPIFGVVRRSREVRRRRRRLVLRGSRRLDWRRTR